MIIEQAFMSLPEILTASGYARQESEAGIVSAYSMAVLQELNGRNVANPISLISAEQRYSGDFPRLRADLRIRLAKTFAGSKAFAAFGFRFSNWIEAKFFRSRGTPPSTQNLGSVVADIFRLVGLVPLEVDSTDPQSPKLTCGRYFVHAYLGNPLKHLNPNRKAAGAVERAWVRNLLAPGKQEVTTFELENETRSFFQLLGHPLKDAELSVAVTNFRLEPITGEPESSYTAVLTRIDSGRVSFKGRTFTFRPDRTFLCEPAGEFEQLRADLAAALKAGAEPLPELAFEPVDVTTLDIGEVPHD